jgi:hypothetical protein
MKNKKNRAILSLWRGGGVAPVYYDISILENTATLAVGIEE